MAKKFTYTGKLSKPIIAPQMGLLADKEQITEAANEIAKEKIRRMDLLFDAHAIEHGNWIALCFALANAHVSGFSVAKGKVGRKAIWTDFVRAELYLAVEQSGLQITEASEQLVKEQRWANMVKRTRGAKTLYDEYHRADQRWVEMLRYVRAMENPTEDKRQAFLASDTR